MSNVKIQGNVSGSGTLTIAAPNTNTDRTLTLPDESGTVLSSGTPVLAQKGVPAFSAYQNSLQTISNNTETKLQINTEDFDVTGAYDNSSNYRFTPLVAGYYHINFSCYGGGSVNTTLVTAKIVKNGSQYFDYSQGRGGAYQYITTAFSDGVSAGSQLVYLNGSTDYIEMYSRVVGSGTISARGAMSGFLVAKA